MSPRKRIERLPNATGGISRLAYKLAQSKGIDLDEQLQKAGITRAQIEDNRATIKVRDQIKFLNLAASALDDDFLGLHLGQACDLREIGLLYYVLASSETLIDALQRAVRYSTIMNEGILQTCIDGKHFGFSLDYVGVSRHPDRHQIEFVVTVMVRTCRQLTGSRFVPERVRLTHHRTAKAELGELFGDHIEFGASADEVLLPSELRELPGHQRRSVSQQPADCLLRGRACPSEEKAGLVPVGGGKCDCAAATARKGDSGRSRATSRTKSEDIRATPVLGRTYVLRVAGKYAIQSRQPIPGGRRHGRLRSCLAAGLS